MALSEKGKLLRIFIGESDRHEGQPLYQWLVEEAHRQGLAGATVLRGLEGFGATSRLHTVRMLRLSTDLPLVVEFVDTDEKIDAFLPTVESTISQGLATVEAVQMRFFRTGD